MTRRKDLIFLAAGVLAFIAACLLVRPIGVTIVDEVHYFTEAQALRYGLPLGNAHSYALENGMIPFRGPLYPPAWPATLAPFTTLRWPWAFAPAAFLHVLTALTLAVLFKRRGLSPAWALLSLAQPTLLAFSRTLMAEPMAVFQTALLLLLADSESALLLGLVAGFAPLIKLSQLLVVVPFAAVWIWRHPVHIRARVGARAALGAAPGLVAFLVFNHGAYGHWLDAGYRANYAGPLQALVWLGIGVAQLAVAWPLLPLGLLRSRAHEAAGALAMLVYLAFYGYHYQSQSFVNTLVVGARLHSSAIVLLLPGYAALLSSFGKPLRDVALGALTAFSLVAAVFVLRAVSNRRSEIEETRNQVLASLREPCLVGYSKPSLKLLLPLPSGKILRGPEDVEGLDADLGRGLCVDLVDLLSEPTTYEHPPVYPDAFDSLLSKWPTRDRSPAPQLRVFWLDPKKPFKPVGAGQ